MGIARTTGRKYLHGPLRYQGCNLPNVYTELGKARLNLFLAHGGRDTQVGIALKCSLESHQLECDLITEVFHLDFQKYGGLITNTTLKHTWEFLHRFNLKLDTKHAVPKLLRESDEAIMEAIIARTSYCKKELQEINMCRLYLQVVTLADITEGNGNHITTYAAEGERDLSRISKWKWPNIPYPPSSAWAKWRGAINATFLSGNTRSLTRPLRKWINVPHQNWIWFLDENYEVLYEKKAMSATHTHLLVVSSEVRRATT